jgi:hypothetical protein
MDFFVSLLLKNWKLVLLGTVISCLVGLLALQTTRLDSAKAELSEIQRVANEAQTQTEANLETIRNAIPVMVSQAQAGAVRNYCARHPDRCRPAVANPVPERVRPDSGSEATSSSGVDETCTYPIFARPTDELKDLIRECAATTALYNAWRELCTLNTQLCEVVK